MKQLLFGVPVCAGKRESVLGECRALVGRGGAVFTLNALMLERARRDAAFRETLAAGDICTVDGVGVCLALAARGVAAELLPGVELGEAIVERGSPSLAIIGGRDGVGAAAFSYLKARNPKIRRSFIISGYGHTEEEYLVLIRRYRPKICFVCLGSPRQEDFVLKARTASPKTMLLALGGSLDIYSGRLSRAPVPCRALGLEWLYRIAQEPRRLSTLPQLVSFALVTLLPSTTKNNQKSIALGE